MKTENGFTLVELMIVIAIVGIVAASSLVFPPLLQKNGVESYTKEIQALLVKARNDASNMNIPCSVTLATNQIQIFMDRNGNNAADAGETKTKNYPKFAINFSATPIVFDRRGITSNGQTISLTYTGSAPSVDCVVISSTRINIGKMNGANNCVQQ